MAASPQMLRVEHGLRMLESEHGASRQFIAIARSIGTHDRASDVAHDIESQWGGHGLPSAFAKAVVAVNSLSDAWATEAGRDLAAAYVASIAGQSLFDAIARYAQVIPPNLSRILIASGAVGDIVAEGEPKAVTRLELTPADADRRKAAGILVYSKELATVPGSARIFEQELRVTLLSAFNAAVLGALDTIAITGTGSALGDLTAGLEAAVPSTGYVIAARREVAVELALAADGRMGIDGGEFVPGVVIVPVDSASGDPQLTVVPADRIGLTDYGMQVANAGHANVQMSDTPAGVGVMTNLWQSNLRALLIERSFRLACASPAVKVG